ncbi:MAG: cytochrome c maturation protein CcmE [Candidatus Methylumidiphilus alinenensis]|uniref:Cytochrome c-type biogenesis protein CcmE n=1 Tax=Candidatus Methylumidiphilus alinenensis TaxID=2202197 RepID=A0A2W4QEK0_9GAMM|nr:MAG: cytochrome c maturation protein CcmE [Candidatus Methylumidiphilus alinenensis]
MTPRQKRMVLVGLILAGVAGAVFLALTAFQKNLLYFYTPSQVAAGEAPKDYTFRVGGLVVQGSVKRSEGVTVRFDVTDGAATVPVTYTGILPDLFREGQGIISIGKMNGQGVFEASEVLAKHDENYMPPEVGEALKKTGKMPPTTYKDYRK